MDFIKTIEVDGVVYEIYDEGARTLMVVKASGLTAGLVYDYIVNASGTTTTCVSPIIAGSGASSLMQQSLPLTGESAGFRANTVLGNFSAAFGTRNIVGAKSSEALVAGGLLEDYGQNNFVFGYRSKSYVNQNLTGGYKCTNKASESIQVGNQLTLDGVLTEDEDGNPKSNSRYNAQFGQSSSMGTNTVNCFMAGQGHTQDHSAKWNAVFGKTHVLGHHNECLNVFGASNITHDYLTDSTLIGYDHEAFGGTSTSNIKYDVYMLGHNSTNRDSNNTAHNNVYLIGKYLRAKEDDQVIVGAYNAGVANCRFEVGCGTSSARATAFAVCQSGSNKWIKIGGTELSETQLQALLALIA